MSTDRWGQTSNKKYFPHYLKGDKKKKKKAIFKIWKISKQFITRFFIYIFGEQSYHKTSQTDKDIIITTNYHDWWWSFVNNGKLLMLQDKYTSVIKCKNLIARDL
jgi:hypothetical protein